MLAPSAIEEVRSSLHDPPRILVSVEDEAQRAALARALRDTGYDVTESTDPDGTAGAEGAGGDGFDLVLADTARCRRSSTPTVILSESFDIVEIEMLVLDVLGWDGPPTVRRMPAWQVTT
jgi:CheY-like chemotaxis protein